MKKPYMIQRMYFKEDPPNDFSFDGLLQMDYMGSAEFEFGALPQSLKIMCKNIDDYNMIMLKEYINQSNQRLCLIAHKDIIDEYIPFIELFKEDKIYTKERLEFQVHITGKDLFNRPAKQSDLKIKAWWDIENHVIFTFGKSNANNIIKAIKNTREKKKSQNQEGWF